MLRKCKYISVQSNKYEHHSKHTLFVLFVVINVEANLISMINSSNNVESRVIFSPFLDREWIERTIAQNDKDGDGGISLDEFIEMNIRGKNRQTKSAVEERKSQSDIIHEKARLAFNAYDRNRDGYLTKAEMKKTSKMMTEAQIDAVFEKYDKNKDGKLEFEEFKELMESNSRYKTNQKPKTSATSATSSSSTSSSNTSSEKASAPLTASSEQSSSSSKDLLEQE